ncbi:MAG: hypothetical protein Q7K28_02205, partial [Candidatus Wildermuthbacteria bacterium]|nr:hypothetical protein [Candidatus Wildermuthbacteria bacterium]
MIVSSNPRKGDFKMVNYLRHPLWGQKIIVIFAFAIINSGVFPFFQEKTHEIKADEPNSTPVIENGVSLLISQDSALISTSNPNNPDPEVIQKINVVITAYSST